MGKGKPPQPTFHETFLISFDVNKQDQTFKIKLRDEWGRCLQYSANVKEAWLREALIELGWSPPTQEDK